MTRHLLVRELQQVRGIPIQRVIKRGSAYPLLSCAPLAFKDIMQYLAPGTSYAQWLNSYKSSLPLVQSKGAFPHDWLKRIDQLNQTQFVDRSDFFSRLRNEGISRTQYEDCLEVWRSLGPDATMWQYLEHYNMLGENFQACLESMRVFWKSKGICMTTACVSLSGLSQKLLHQFVDPWTFLWLPRDSSERERHLYARIDESMAGGPSIVFSRLTVKGTTRIRDGPRLCQSIVGFDYNVSLNVWWSGVELATAIYCFRAYICIGSPRSCQ